MLDRQGRTIDYLRISVTDRCNLRCRYCMPEEGLDWLPHEGVLSDDEMLVLVREVFVPLGIRKLRLTGGEPLLRKGVVDLVARLARVDGIEDLALTTNGTHLPALARPLAEAGLQRLNLSLDTLREDRFVAISRREGLSRVLAGLDAALAAGLSPLKINMVVMPGVNDDEVADLAALTLDRPVAVRYIEFMPVGDRAAYDRLGHLPVAEVRERVRDAFPDRELLEAEGPRGNGPATHMRLAGAAGTLGFISPMTENFCARCTRLRLTADGQIKPCLLFPDEVDLRGPLRAGDSPEALRERVMASFSLKRDRHEQGLVTFPRTMSAIGG